MKISNISYLAESLIGLDYQGFMLRRKIQKENENRKIENYDREIEKQLKRFYTSLQDLINSRNNKPTLEPKEDIEYWLNDSSKMINFYLIQKKNSMQTGESVPYVLEFSRFSNLVYFLKEASKLVETKDIAENLMERRGELIEKLGIEYISNLN